MNAMSWAMADAATTAAVEAVVAEVEGAKSEDAEGTAARFSEARAALRFILAGNARFTFVSDKTGARFTYRVQASKDGKVRFVSLLTGPSNETDFTFLGTIFADGRFFFGKKSRISKDAPGAKAFAWAWTHLDANRLPPSCSIHHEGRCGKCGRALTVPESIATGLGPVCAEGRG